MSSASLLTRGSWRVLAWCAFAGCARTGEIEGAVVGYLDGAPVAGVELGVSGTDLRAITDAEGRYAFEAVVPGPQGVRVTSEGYTAQGVLELTVGAGTTVQAEPVRVLPVGPARGAYALEDGAVKELVSPRRARFELQTLGLDVGWRSNWFPPSEVTVVASPLLLIVQDGDSSARRLTITKLRAMDVAVGMGFDIPPTPSWVALSGDRYQASVENVREGLQIVRAELDEGVYLLEQSFGQGSRLTPFRVPPRGPELTVAGRGAFESTSAEYAEAVRTVGEWCASATSKWEQKQCRSVAPLLSASPSADCPGRFTISEDAESATLTTSECVEHVRAEFVRVGSDYFVDGVHVRAARPVSLHAGVDSADRLPTTAGEAGAHAGSSLSVAEYAAAARQRAIEELRRRQALVGASEGEGE